MNPLWQGCELAFAHMLTLCSSPFVVQTPRILVSDPVAAEHIFKHTDMWQKDDTTRNVLTRILGDGLLNVEGAHHRRQRRIMNP